FHAPSRVRLRSKAGFVRRSKSLRTDVSPASANLSVVRPETTPQWSAFWAWFSDGIHCTPTSMCSPVARNATCRFVGWTEPRRSDSCHRTSPRATRGSGGVRGATRPSGGVVTCETVFNGWRGVAGRWERASRMTVLGRRDCLSFAVGRLVAILAHCMHLRIPHVSRLSIIRYWDFHVRPVHPRPRKVSYSPLTTTRNS